MTYEEEMTCFPRHQYGSIYFFQALIFFAANGEGLALGPLSRHGGGGGQAVDLSIQLLKNRSLAVIPAKAGIRAPGSRRDLRGESPLPGDARSR